MIFGLWPSVYDSWACVWSPWKLRWSLFDSLITKQSQKPCYQVAQRDFFYLLPCFLEILKAMGPSMSAAFADLFQIFCLILKSVGLGSAWAWRRSIFACFGTTVHCHISHPGGTLGHPRWWSWRQCCFITVDKRCQSTGSAGEATPQNWMKSVGQPSLVMRIPVDS